MQDSEILAHEVFGKHTFDNNASNIDQETIFDVASLTKVLCTTPIIMKLINQKKISLNHKVKQYFPEFVDEGRGQVTIRHLLTHSSGLKPFEEYYKKGFSREDILFDILNNQKLEFKPGENVLYSDLGMLLLTAIIEKISGLRLDDLAHKYIYRPFNMSFTTFNPIKKKINNIAPTEYDSLFRNRLLIGEVHDENAFIFDGVAGHAGLFSNAYDIGKYCQVMLNKGTWLGHRYFKENLINEFVQRQTIPIQSDRAIGWDTPSTGNKSSAGDYISRNSYGHLGFTGTSMWVDPENNLVIIVLTNRVFPTRDKKDVNKRMYTFRRTFHQEISKTILGI